MLEHGRPFETKLAEERSVAMGEGDVAAAAASAERVGRIQPLAASVSDVLRTLAYDSLQVRTAAHKCNRKQT